MKIVAKSDGKKNERGGEKEEGEIEVGSIGFSNWVKSLTAIHFNGPMIFNDVRTLPTKYTKYTPTPHTLYHSHIVLLPKSELLLAIFGLQQHLQLRHDAFDIYFVSCKCKLLVLVK